VPSPEVYEIKSKGSFGEGYAAAAADLIYYLWILNTNEPRGRIWRPGTTFYPPPVFYLPVQGGWLIKAELVGPGVILYEALNVPVTVATLAAVAVAAGMLQTSGVSVQFGLRLSLRFTF
jgi:hypothetical protein